MENNIYTIFPETFLKTLEIAKDMNLLSEQTAGILRGIFAKTLEEEMKKDIAQQRKDR